jgi:hypothetical protein
MSRIKFNPEINLGHLVQLFGFVLAVVGLYYAMDKRVSILEQSIVVQRSQLTEVIRAVDDNSKSIVRLVTLQEQSHLRDTWTQERSRAVDEWKRKGVN